MTEERKTGSCDRCGLQLALNFADDEMTVGYYNAVAWEQFANDGELYICDHCMWADPRYIAVYGVQT